MAIIVSMKAYRSAPRCEPAKDQRPAKRLTNYGKRWGQMGVFLQMLEGLAAASADARTVMIDASCLNAHRTTSSLAA